MTNRLKLTTAFFMFVALFATQLQAQQVLVLDAAQQQAYDNISAATADGEISAEDQAVIDAARAVLPDTVVAGAMAENNVPADAQVLALVPAGATQTQITAAATAVVNATNSTGATVATATPATIGTAVVTALVRAGTPAAAATAAANNAATAAVATIPNNTQAAAPVTAAQTTTIATTVANQPAPVLSTVATNVNALAPTAPAPTPTPTGGNTPAPVPTTPPASSGPNIVLVAVVTQTPIVNSNNVANNEDTTPVIPPATDIPPIHG